MTIRIIQNGTKDKNLNRNYADEWRNSNQQLVPNNNNVESEVPDSAVDAIASAMDSCQDSKCVQPYEKPKITPQSQQYGGHYGEQDRQIDMPQLDDASEMPFVPPTPEEEAMRMINQFAKQNGSIVIPKEDRPKGDNLLLG
jgi:hypothetical protein